MSHYACVCRSIILLKKERNKTAKKPSMGLFVRLEVVGLELLGKHLRRGFVTGWTRWEVNPCMRFG